MLRSPLLGHTVCLPSSHCPRRFLALLQLKLPYASLINTVAMLLHILSLAFLLSKPVWAGGLSGAYERVWIWYAYQIDLLNPEALRTIGVGCKTKSGDPIDFCYFTELIEWIDSTEPKGQWWDTKDSEILPTDPRNLRPDPASTARYMNQRWAMDNIAPKRFLKNPKVGYLGMFDVIADVIKDTRTRLSADDVQKNKELFNTAHECLRQAQGYRNADWHHYVKSDLKQDRNIRDIKVGPMQTEFGVCLDIAGAERLEENQGIKNVSDRLKNWIQVWFNWFTLRSGVGKTQMTNCSRKPTHPSR